MDNGPGQSIKQEHMANRSRKSKGHAGPEGSATPRDAYDELEARLRERGRYVAELEKELEHQEALVRDVLERWEQVQTPAPETKAADTGTVRRLHDENASLTMQITTVQERAKELETVAAAKDALITRLQFELADLENTDSSGDDQVARLREENERLRDVVLGAAAQADKWPGLLKAWKAQRQALQRVRWILRDLQAEESGQALRQTVVGIETPPTNEEQRVGKD